MNRKGILVVISGFSGVGKGTLVRRLMERYKEQYALSVSATTREPREGEQDGREYFFRKKEEFEKLIADMDLEMNMKVRNLSSGMMAKLKIAVTLSRKAELYLLDEPLNGIDLLARDEVVNTILTNMSDNASVVISSHLVEELERIIDKAIFMKDGQIVLMGDVEEIRQERGESVTDLYRQIYG